MPDRASAAKHTDEQYRRFDPFAGDKGGPDYEFRNVKIVRTRTPHVCMGASLEGRHKLEPGARARRDTAKFDGEIHTIYLCLRCMDAMVEPDGFCWVCGTEHPDA